MLKTLFNRKRPIFSDGEIDLVPLDLTPPDRSLGFGRVLDYSVRPAGRWVEAGRLSIRLGEGRGVYYFGHIGYHINPRWQGHHWAARACALVIPMLRSRGVRSMVITCDPDNQASRKTCLALGCTLERVVDVPEDMQARWDLSAVKCRYIWQLTPCPPPPLHREEHHCD